MLGGAGAGIRELFDRGSLVAGKRGQSGPPDNLHAAKHPWRSFWRRRALRPADRWILLVLEGYALALSSDKSGMTETETLMTQNAQTARGAAMLILAGAARSGLTRQTGATWDLAPGAKELAKFLTAERGGVAGHRVGPASTAGTVPGGISRDELRVRPRPRVSGGHRGGRRRVMSPPRW